MKKINIVFIVLVALLLIAPHKIYASDNVDVTNISNDAYNIMFFAKNYKDISEMNEYFIGKKLDDYTIKGSVWYGEKGATGEFYWDNPNYIIKAGEQTVKCCYKLDFDYTNKFEIPTDEVLTFDVTFTGTEFKRKIDP